MFIAALFRVAKMWKPPKHPHPDEYINKMWYITTMEHYSVMKRNKVLIQAATRMNLENMMLS